MDDREQGYKQSLCEPRAMLVNCDLSSHTHTHTHTHTHFFISYSHFSLLVPISLSGIGQPSSLWGFPDSLYSYFLIFFCLSWNFQVRQT
jgi:hypothetical protein